MAIYRLQHSIILQTINSRNNRFKKASYIINAIIHCRISGFNDEALAYEIKRAGGKVVTTVTSSTTIVLVKDINSKDTKAVVVARSLGIPIVKHEYFRNIKVYGFEDNDEYAKYIESESKMPFVPSFKAAKKEFKDIQHGDLIEYDDDEEHLFHECFIVYKVGGVEKLIRNPDDEDGLLIPLEVSEHMVDPWRQYDYIFENHAHALRIELAPTSKLVRGIPYLAKDIIKSGTFVAIDNLANVYTRDETDDTFALEVSYKGKRERFAYNVDRPPDGNVINDFFKTIQEQQTIRLGIILKVDNEKEHHQPLKAATLKKIIRGTGWKEGASPFEIHGPHDKIAKVMKNIENI